jgi:23S rRNA (guanosine2251-2'-O)-methyltransferase
MIKKLSMEELDRPDKDAFLKTEKFPVILVLDNVRSALNVGSIFRTADALALEQVFLCGITATPPHREILKTALGSTETVTWTYCSDTATAIHTLQDAGYLVFALEQAAPRIWLQEFAPLPGERYALIIGNEVEGVGDAALALCDGALEIPQFGTKHSLNVAVAAGIAVWEIVRKLRWE